MDGGNCLGAQFWRLPVKNLQRLVKSGSDMHPINVLIRLSVYCDSQNA